MAFVLKSCLNGSFLPSAYFLSLSLSLILRPTVSRPVYLGIKDPSGAYDQIFITVRQLRVSWYEAPSLMRRLVCRLQLLLARAIAVFLGSESRGTRDHILLSQIRDFLSVASYDSQGYGGGMRPRLHTGYWIKWILSLSLMLGPTVSRPVCIGIKHPSGA
jgi:hypothetical protein